MSAAISFASVPTLSSGMLGSAGAGIPSLVLSVPASERLLAAVGVEKDALVKALADDGDMPVAKADVRVNPRYGRWNPRFGVCPPTGCAAATG